MVVIFMPFLPNLAVFLGISVWYLVPTYWIVVIYRFIERNMAICNLAKKIGFSFVIFILHIYLNFAWKIFAAGQEEETRSGYTVIKTTFFDTNQLQWTQRFGRTLDGIRSTAMYFRFTICHMSTTERPFFLSRKRHNSRIFFFRTIIVSSTPLV